MRKPKVHAFILKGLLFSLLVSGCALQSSMVDIEDTSLRLRNHQLQLQRRIENLERDQNMPSLIVKNQRALSADLVAQLGVIEVDVREFSGQVSESQHQLSKLETQLETESFRTKELMSRLDALAQRISVLETGKKASKEKTPLSLGGSEKKFFGPRDAFNLAYNDYVKGNYGVAILAFDAFIKQYSSNRLVPQAVYWQGESHYAKASYALAVVFFKRVVDHYPASEKVSKSLLKMGFSYLELKKPKEGRFFLEKVINQFPNSNEAALARDALNSLSLSTP